MLRGVWIEGFEANGVGLTWGMMTIRVGRDQMPVEEREPTQPMMATARANWMMRRPSLEAHIPTGEMWGGAGLAASTDIVVMVELDVAGLPVNEKGSKGVVVMGWS